MPIHHQCGWGQVVPKVYPCPEACPSKDYHRKKLPWSHDMTLAHTLGHYHGSLWCPWLGLDGCSTQDLLHQQCEMVWHMWPFSMGLYASFTCTYDTCKFLHKSAVSEPAKVMVVVTFLTMVSASSQVNSPLVWLEQSNGVFPAHCWLLLALRDKPRALFLVVLAGKCLLHYYRLLFQLYLCAPN